MKYKCKVLTDEFYRKVQDIIDEELKESLGYEKIFEQNRLWNFIHEMWKEKNSVILKKIEIDIPEYTEQEFESQDKGFQSQPRILWLSEICKINDINQIFSYERID